MTEKIIIAGFGGQGIILAGKILAHAGMIEGKNVSHFPSYGAEMRGGTANCSVVVSDRQVASPLISKPTSLIVMNQPSLEKYEDSVVPGGKVFVNESLIRMKVKRSDIEVFYIPANKLAEEAGSGKASNMAIMGAYIAATGVVQPDTFKKSIPEVVSARNVRLNEINLKAFDLGYGYRGKRS
jgi:2-oxoglutarate ferredoxin oxidoreductase subunit gamma